MATAGLIQTLTGDTPADAMAPPAVPPRRVARPRGPRRWSQRLQRPIPDEADSTMTPEPPADDAAPRRPPRPRFSRAGGRRLKRRRAAARAASRAHRRRGGHAGQCPTCPTWRTAEDDEIEDLGEAPSPFTFPRDRGRMLLDEETLRDIIAEVVREELHGRDGPAHHAQRPQDGAPRDQAGAGGRGSGVTGRPRHPARDRPLTGIGVAPEVRAMFPIRDHNPRRNPARPSSPGR